MQTRREKQGTRHKGAAGTKRETARLELDNVLSVHRIGSHGVKGKGRPGETKGKEATTTRERRVLLYTRAYYMVCCCIHGRSHIGVAGRFFVRLPLVPLRDRTPRRQASENEQKS